LLKDLQKFNEKLLTKIENKFFKQKQKSIKNKKNLISSNCSLPKMKFLIIEKL
jgi:hypothetical protein